MDSIHFDETQVLIIDEKLNHDEVLKKMADQLQVKGYVKNSYYPAIIEREKNYPTGLFTEAINVAIPHCDIANVNQGSICVGVLKQPTQFARMDEPDVMIDVQLVVMLALTLPHGHIEMLQKVVALIQNQDIVKSIVHSSNQKEIYETIKKYLL